MKLKEGFILQEVAGETVVLPTGDDLDMNMMITLNSTARFLWERMEQETTKDALVDALVAGPDAFKGKDPIDSFCGLWDARL